MSLPRYPEYKDSGVEWLGAVPAHWRVVRYKTFLRERTERSVDGSETLLSVSAYTGVSPRTELIEGGEFLSRAESLEGYKNCYPGDLVINIMLAWNRGLGVTRYEGIVSPSYCVFDVDGGISPSFLDYMTRSDRSTLYYKAFSSGVIDSRLRLYPDTFGALYCVLPPKVEQDAIAAFLDRETAKIDALIAEQEKLLALLAEKRQATISHAVTRGLDPNVPMKDSGIPWLGEVPAHWDVCPFKYVGRVGNGSTPNRDNPDYWGQSGFPWLNSAAVNQREVTEAERFVTELALKECHLPVIQPPAVLVGLTGQGKTRGMAAQLMFETTISQHLAYMIPDSERLHVSYLLRAVETAYERLRNDSEGVGSTKGAITCDQLSRLDLPLPPLDEQYAIVERLGMKSAEFDSLVEESMRGIALLKDRRSALIAAAVTGQIDVRGLVDREAA
ncbi:restriction endonuclease subunit S [Pseudoxanthomonas suwonensis]|uniref:restriction endonuclease subunit S n=1 Tax=Pseudoxanthomonas suwonensis TaxID=314722 RepID=UPI00048AFEBE|nr:restriction endonuclease subunit S [Pseudoxanthomonas suwonensis]